MCGRYYMDEETAKEAAKLVGDLDKDVLMEREGGDVFPSQGAPVLIQNNLKREWRAKVMRWGFPGYLGKGLLINARAESVLDKRTFRESILHRRCAILARGFYEWNKQKEKFRFERRDSMPIMFLAGCYCELQGENHFVILTTAANASVSPVHERMPLILEREELETWVFEDRLCETLLRKEPVILRSKTDYEQISLF